MNAIVASLALSLGLTLLIEIPLVLLWGFRKEEILVAVLVNIVTNPIAVLIFWGLHALLSSTRSLLLQIPIELFVVAVEWMLYRNCTECRRPLLVSLTCNAASYATGVLIGLII